MHGSVARSSRMRRLSGKETKKSAEVVATK